MHYLQFGSRRGIGVPEAVWVADELTAHWASRRKPLIEVLLDMRKVYHSARRVHVYSKLRRRGVPAHVIAVLQALFDGCHFIIAMDGQLSERIAALVGLFQTLLPRGHLSAPYRQGFPRQYAANRCDVIIRYRLHTWGTQLLVELQRGLVPNQPRFFRGAMRTAPGTTTLYSSAVADGAVVTGFMFTTPLQASTCLDADAQAIAQLRDDIETSTGISNTRLVNLGIASEDGPPQVCDLNFIILPPDGPSAITTDQFRSVATDADSGLCHACQEQITQPQGWLSIATVIVTGLVAIGVLLIVLAVMLANRMRPFLWGAKPAVVRVEPNFGLAMPLPSNKVYDDTGRTFMYRTPEFLKKAIAGRKKQDRYQQQHSDTNVDNYPIAIMNVTS
ncbi:unnamed protein product (mitochondrion) [Plasmodiophora brassicae]|uniref:Reverse transcriptase domain-containing protein n=1 Tax=Plasmodiophora brassicae TaxID=37360 RepID=A0A3P3YLJ5_PLABS|nr:unnamed protein product [Plasmodiophora brassicae]